MQNTYAAWAQVYMGVGCIYMHVQMLSPTFVTFPPLFGSVQHEYPVSLSEKHRVRVLLAKLTT